MAKATILTSANLGFEDKLWAAADKLHGNMLTAARRIRALSAPKTLLRGTGCNQLAESAQVSLEGPAWCCVGPVFSLPDYRESSS